VEPCKSIVWLRTLLAEAKIPQLITCFHTVGDNTAADAIAERYGISEKSKHFGIKASFVQDLVAAGVVVQEHVCLPI
jgi:hypothetical protein